VKVVIGTDHRGYHHKEFIKEKISFDTIEWVDVGAQSDERSDYPDFAIAAVHKIQQREAHVGVLLCGTGVGMSIVANRFYGIFAGLVWNMTVAREAKEDDNINILVLPADFVSPEESVDIIEVWLTAQFKGGHYQNRIDTINALGGIR